VLIKVEALSHDEAAQRGVETWPLRHHDVARIPITYSETTVCYVVDGQARIETEDGNVEVETGDLVTLPAGLECTWLIRIPVATREEPRPDGRERAVPV
jgi:uncharacterized cupin superfamily protein